MKLNGAWDVAHVTVDGVSGHVHRGATNVEIRECSPWVMFLWEGKMRWTSAPVVLTECRTPGPEAPEEP